MRSENGSIRCGNRGRSERNQAQRSSPQRLFEEWLPAPSVANMPQPAFIHAGVARPASASASSPDWAGRARDTRTRARRRRELETEESREQGAPEGRTQRLIQHNCYAHQPGRGTTRGSDFNDGGRLADPHDAQFSLPNFAPGPVSQTQDKKREPSSETRPPALALCNGSMSLRHIGNSFTSQIRS